MRAGSLCGIAAALWLASAACDRRIEKLDPNERPSQPDLSKIFPPGAARREAMPAGMPEPPRGAPSIAETAAETSERAPIRGTLLLADAVRARVPSGAVLFLIARRGESGPPLAVKRISGPSFPLEFEIGPGDRMIKSMPFEGTLQLSARLDGDGNATSRTPGDLLSSTAAQAQPGDSGVQLVIDSVL